MGNFEEDTVAGSKNSNYIVTQKNFDEIVYKINSRPRKVLGYLTPNEVFKE